MDKFMNKKKNNLEYLILFKIFEFLIFENIYFLLFCNPHKIT